MFTIAFTSDHADLAQRIRLDLENAGFTVTESLQKTQDTVVVLVLSPAAIQHPNLQTAMIHAIDNGQHILPVIAQPVALPAMINHLVPLDLSQHYDTNALLAYAAALKSPAAGRPLRALTPTVRASNRRAGYFLAILVIFWFVAGLILVGIYGIQAPPREYADVETHVIQTREYYLDQNQPRTTQDALNFSSTLQAAPTAQRPFLIETATAVAGENE